MALAFMIHLCFPIFQFVSDNLHDPAVDVGSGDLLDIKAPGGMRCFQMDICLYTQTHVWIDGCWDLLSPPEYLKTRAFL